MEASLFSISDFIQEVCGWIGCVMNLYFYVKPIMPFVSVIKGKKNFEESPGLYVTILYINSVCWYTYGELTFSDQMRISYIIGSIIYLGLICIYLYYEINKYLFDTILNILILITGTYSLYVGLAIILDEDQIAAKFCNVASLVYFFFPVQIIYKVINYKNYKIISVKDNIINIFTSSMWIVYGTLILENLLVYPHVINVILSFIQLYLYYNYKNKFPYIAEEESNTIGIENNGEEKNLEETNKIKGFDEAQEGLKERPVKIIDQVNKDN